MNQLSRFPDWLNLIEQLVSLSTVEEMGLMATRRLSKCTGNDVCGIALPDSTNTLRYRWVDGMPVEKHDKAQFLMSGVPIEESFTGKAFRSVFPVYLPDYSQEPTAVSRFLSVGVRAIIFAPIRFSDKAYGVLALLSRDQPNAYPDAVVAEVGRMGRVLGAAFRQDELTSALKREQEFMTLALDAMRDDFFVFDLNGHLMRWNRRLRESTGMTDKQLPELCPEDFFHPDDRERVRDAVTDLIERGAGGVTARRIKPDGSLALYDAQGMVIRGEDRQPIGVVGTARDVTEARRARDALAAEREVLAAAFDSLSEVLVVADAHGRIEQVNPAAERVFRRSAAEMKGYQFTEIFPVLYLRDVELALQRIGWRPEVEFSVQLVATGQVPRDYRFRLAAIRGPQGSLKSLVLVGRDCTEDLEERRRLRSLAHTDSLTGLANRSYLLERTYKVMSETKGQDVYAALLFIDLDGFKDVNDSNGHGTGDRLLRLVGERLRHSLRRADTVSRIGGDEFVVLLADSADKRAPEQVARHILNVLSSPFSLAGQRYQLGASIGIAVAPQNGLVAEELLLAADQAMYEAKASGRGCWRLAMDRAA